MDVRIVPVDEQQCLIPDDVVRVAFMQREDIAVLDETEREKRWAAHLVGLNRFREFLATIPSIVAN